MNRTSILWVVCALLFGGGCASAALEEDQALVQYKAYLVALRAGNTHEILKMAVPVSKPVKSIQLEATKSRTLMERLRRETIAQFGPMKLDLKHDDPWFGIGESWDEYLGDVKFEKTEELIAVEIRKPYPDLPVAFFLRRDGKLLLPIGLDMNIDTSDEKGALFTEPEPDDRERVLKHFQIVNEALGVVLKRLATKEFKNSTDVIKALQGEIPQGESLLHY